MENDSFVSWLIEKKGLRKKSARDVISRIKRVKKFVNLIKKSTAEKIINDLNSDKRFCRLSVAVKSQMRRAVRLYFTYK